MIQFPSVFWMVVFFILAVFPLVVLHELGHYWVARLFGIKAEVFSIGFGKRITGWTDKRGTRWQVSWIPLGGYVRFAGDMSPAGQTDPEWLKLPPAERNQTFQSKTLWQRALVVAAGPAANFLFAIVMMIGLFGVYGVVRTVPLVGKFATISPARDAGLRVGDRIVSVNGTEITRYEDIPLIVQARANQPTAFVVERAGQKFPIMITPRQGEIPDLTGAKIPVGQIGIMQDLTERGITRVRLSVAELPGAAAQFTYDAVRVTIVGLGQIITGNRSVKELGGPVKMAAVSKAVAQFGFVTFLSFMVGVSINLGFINLLPIPTLDGGHLAFYAVEAVQRKPVGPIAQEWAYRSGLFILLAFMLFVTINDLAGLGLFGRLAG